MAINRAKTLELAQKLSGQGKLKEAISEYEKLFRADPKDQTVLNVLGDLNVRLKNLPEGLGYFARLADVYVSSGFLVRGIAMYKKISKLDPSNITALQRLAELYSMQGLMTEARSQYLQLAEICLRNDKTSQAVGIMQKLLDLEPDNITLQQRLGDLYQRHGQKKEAADIFRRLASRKLDQGDMPGSLQWLEKAAKLVANDPQTLLLQARVAQQSGKTADALAALEKIPDANQSPDGLETLANLRMETGDVSGAEKIAEKLFETQPTRFAVLLRIAEHAARNRQPDRAMELIRRIAEPALDRGPASLLASLQAMSEVMPDSAELVELTARAARRSGDQGALVTMLARQGQSALRAEDLARAKELYSELTRLAPENDEFTQQYNLLREKLGEVTAPEAPTVPVEPQPRAVETAGRAAEQELDEQTRTYVDATLTDIDLFSSYGMNDKAMELAEQLLGRVPDHLPTSERLLDFYLGSGDDQRVVDIAARVTRLNRQAGNAQRAEEVGDLVRRYAEKIGQPVPAEALGLIEPGEEAVSAQAAPPVPGSAESKVHEVDLTAEWGANLAEEEPAESVAATFNTQEADQEIEFYLGQGLFDEAQATVDGYQRDFPDEPALSKFRARIENARAASHRKQKEAVAGQPPSAVPKEEVPAPVGGEETAVPAEEQADYELVLEEQPREADSVEAGSMSAQDFFSGMAEDIAEAVPETEEAAPGEPPAASGGPAVGVHPPSAPFARPSRAPGGGTAAPQPLAEVFQEFKEELEEVEEVEDIETHYNLGVAFKEMGLYEEAIGEFQKAVKAAEKQQAFTHLVQSCILLALCFREKGMAQLAVRWYERSLKVPGLDAEGVLAIRYDMGDALEEAGDRKGALECFMEVYGTNVDYRNVGERIRQLSLSPNS